MKIHDFVQKSPEWYVHRNEHFNASDAPAMKGYSPYQTRSDLLKQYATGLSRDFDANTQKIFDNGHRFEALARPIAEKIIGDDLYPVVGSSGKLSASFDGITLDEAIIFEHKTLNKEIRQAQTAADLGIHLRIQMEQQLLISEAEKCLFMASTWDSNDELVEEVHFWYLPNFELRAQIIAGWDQFEKDLAEYVPVEVMPAAVAAPTLNLPAVSVQVQGSIALISNLDVFGDALRGFISKIPENPSTDQEFADCKSAIGKLQDAQDALDAAEANALGQIATFDDMRNTKALYFDLARTTRLALEKLVTARESAIKIELTQGGKDKLAEHVAALNKRLGKPYMPMIVADWGAAIKNKRTISSLQNAVDTLLSQKRIEASAAADRIEMNLNSLREMAKDHGFLFSDVSTIVGKANDDLISLIKSRIADHAAAETKRLEAERARIAEEERVKAEAKYKAEQDAVAEKARADQALADRLTTAQQREDARQAEIAGAVLLQRANTEPASVPVVSPVVSVPIEKPAPITSAPMLTLGKIGTRLGFPLTAEFLRSIGFEPAGHERAAVLYHESDWTLICERLSAHINSISVWKEVA